MNFKIKNNEDKIKELHKLIVENRKEKEENYYWESSGDLYSFNE
jgi:hypothetical protein